MQGNRDFGAGEWQRLKQIIKVEEPISLHRIARFCADLKVWDIDHTLLAMERAGVVRRDQQEISVGRQREVWSLSY
jgi:predicted transcriptional regulator